jgi:hypothetical protein
MYLASRGPSGMGPMDATFGVASAQNRKGVLGSGDPGKIRRVSSDPTIHAYPRVRGMGERCGLGAFSRKEAVLLGREKMFF